MRNHAKLREPSELAGRSVSPSLLIGSDKAATSIEVFINYRRGDTKAEAAHLHASLAYRRGSSKVFRDLDTLRAGENFPSIIEHRIRSASVFLVLIGCRWLTIKDRHGRRLDNPKDYVRLEIESALRQGVTVIPVLVNGAKMPEPEQLPESIAQLATLQRHELPWYESIRSLERRIGEIERQRPERDADAQQLNLLRSFQKASAQTSITTRAIEVSLANQGQSVSLDPNDLAASIKKLTGRPMEQGFGFSDLVYVIDIVGVNAKGSNDRYVARSYPLGSLDEVSIQLKLGRQVLAGATVFESWFKEPSSATGLIDSEHPGSAQGGIIGIAIGWQSQKKQLKLLTPWPNWGDAA